MRATYNEAPAKPSLLLDDCRVRKMSLIARRVVWCPTKELKNSRESSFGLSGCCLSRLNFYSEEFSFGLSGEEKMLQSGP